MKSILTIFGAPGSLAEDLLEHTTKTTTCQGKGGLNQFLTQKRALAHLCGTKSSKQVSDCLPNPTLDVLIF